MQEYTTYASNPTLRVQQSSPAPQLLPEQSMLVQREFLGSGWNEGFVGAGYLTTLSKNLKNQSARIHKRASSGSSITSAGPPSPLDHTINVHPYIATPDNNFSPSYDPTYEYQLTPQSAYTSKSLPTPTSESFMYPGGHGYQSVDMRRIHSAGAEENASYGPNSVSSMGHNSPATPNTHYEVDYSDSKNSYDQGQAFELETAMNKHSPFVAGFGEPSLAYRESLQAVFPDQNYSPNSMGYPQQQMPTRMNNPMAMMSDRIQAAQRDHLRTASPITSNPRQRSPFRQDSPYADAMRAPTQRPQQNVPQLHKTRTSISPKELMLDEHDVDEHATPLFKNNQSPTLYANRRQPSHMANFYTPSFSNEPSVQIPQQYPFVSQPSRQESSQSGIPDSTPDFPAHMASMESTVEEGQSEPSSQQSRTSQKLTSPLVQRPADTSAAGGTYSCTYHGCSLRFETPAKLQKHKREGHRQSSPVSASSPNLVMRNSQAGPHKCERINPSTGKPCNSIFSRPYDLTRHEDTIHNARKQKVRCHLCTEEKTFSRNDALTRHMRVVHPDVMWEGKTRKRHGRD